MPIGGEALRIEGLTKKFGGLAAVDNLTVAFESGRLNAIIGPNGAGKTTLFNLICGELKADRGRVVFNDEDIAGRKPHQVVRRGISRTLQIKSVFPGLSVGENIRIAVLAREGIGSWIRSTKSYPEIDVRISEIIDTVGLTKYRNNLASTLSYGDIALLELGLALANRPKLLLLDEPVCGMGPEETERSVGIIKQLSKDVDVILIEHDMEVVFSIADEIVVLAQGALLARGSAAAISANTDVQEAYLGAPDEDE
ncbi:MAG: ABC transporter ATP-binding protein [Hyphomicrobiaceae bacterium]